jgi:hypothetical protein
VNTELNPWTPEGKENVWRNELRDVDKVALGGAGGKPSFINWLGDIHFVAASVASVNFFGQARVRSNAGWRLTLMALPPLRVFVAGLAHHYQGTPAQNRLAEVSNFFYDLLEAQLRETPTPLDPTVFGRKVSRDDWDLAGLTSPGLVVGQLRWAGAPPLRLARTTTAKKILSTFITIRVLDGATSDSALEELLLRYRELMNVMAT